MAVQVIPFHTHTVKGTTDMVAPYIGIAEEEAKRLDMDIRVHLHVRTGGDPAKHAEVAQVTDRGEGWSPRYDVRITIWEKEFPSARDTMAHELRHVWQEFNGLLEWKPEEGSMDPGPVQHWDGVCQMGVPYREQGHEQDARRYGFSRGDYGDMTFEEYEEAYFSLGQDG